MESHSDPPLPCFCGRTYPNSLDLEEHRRARGHFPSHVCSRSCKHPPASNGKLQRYTCGSCSKICERLDIFEDHRISTGHCYCSNCDLSFESQIALTKHRQTDVHNSEIKCCDCDIYVKNVRALNAHMASSAHRKAMQPKPPAKSEDTAIATDKVHMCDKCQRKFSTCRDLEQHSKSLKHKPLSALKCPFGDGCRRTFAAPSALLHHLESGNCQSGVDRTDIYRIVQSCDKDHLIHSQPALPSSSPSALSAYSPPPSPMISAISLSDESEWSLITPTLSQQTADYGSEQWSLLESERGPLEESIREDATNARNLRCPLCVGKRHSFSTANALQQHLSSPAHCAKLYHCPSNMLPAITSTIGRKERVFSTLSGLAQHLEYGACQGGQRTFLYCIELIQRHLEQAGFEGMRLLLPEIP